MKEIFGMAISIAMFVLIVYSLYDIWVKRDYSIIVKLLATVGILLFPLIGIIVYWVIVHKRTPAGEFGKRLRSRTLDSLSREPRVVLRGRGGNNVDDVAAAIRDARDNADVIYGYFYGEGTTFLKFREVEEKYKRETLEPFVKLLELTDMEYMRYYSEESNGGDEHYDYYVGQMNSAGERHGLGMYSFEWTVCQEGSDGEPYAQMKYIICEWENNRQASTGFVYCFSNAEPHTWILRPDNYKITSEEGFESI